MSPKIHNLELQIGLQCQVEKGQLRKEFVKLHLHHENEVKWEIPVNSSEEPHKHLALGIPPRIT